MLGKALALADTTDLSLQARVEKVLVAGPLEKFTAALRKNNFSSKAVETVQLLKSEELSGSPENIAISLNGSMQLQATDLEEAIRDLAPRYQEMALRLVGEYLQPYNEGHLSTLCQVQHARIHELAEQHGVAEKNIFYLVANSTSSFGLVSMMYRQATGTAAEQFLSRLTVGNKIAELQAKNEEFLIVIQDDMGGSGSTLESPYVNIRNKAKFTGQVVIAPLISSPSAEERFRNPVRCVDTDGVIDAHRTFLAGEVVSRFTESAFFTSLSDEERRTALLLAGQLGYDRNGLMVVFPYMAPNNNNQFFNTRVAPLLTMGAAGIKLPGGMDRLTVEELEQLQEKHRRALVAVG